MIRFYNGLGEVFDQVPLATFIHAGTTYYVVTNRIGSPTIIDETMVITHL